MPSPVESLVRLLSSAHRTGHLAPAAPLDALNAATVPEGYAAQAGVVIALGERVEGWKVGFGPDKLPAAAPLLGGVVAPQGATVALVADGEPLWTAAVGSADLPGRQPLAAEEDIRQALNAAVDRKNQPHFALMFSCIGRGPLFYGNEDRDLLAFRDIFPDTPLLGAYGTGQIAPLAGGNRLFQNTALTLLFESAHV